MDEQRRTTMNISRWDKAKILLTIYMHSVWKKIYICIPVFTGTMGTRKHENFRETESGGRLSGEQPDKSQNLRRAVCTVYFRMYPAPADWETYRSATAFFLWRECGNPRHPAGCISG